MYVHSFQQYYKDGSNGTRDCRWFSGFFLIVKITLFLIYASSLAEISYVLITCALIMAAVIALIVQPFKEAYDIFSFTMGSTILCISGRREPHCNLFTR